MTPSYCIPLHFCINNRALSLMFRVLLVGVRIGFCFRRWGQEGASGEMKREFFSLILPPPLPLPFPSFLRLPFHRNHRWKKGKKERKKRKIRHQILHYFFYRERTIYSSSWGIKEIFIFRDPELKSNFVKAPPNGERKIDSIPWILFASLNPRKTKSRSSRLIVGSWNQNSSYRDKGAVR